MDEPRITGQPEAAIAGNRAAFVDALRRGDTKAAASVYAETARLLPPSADLIEGREAIEAFWQAGLHAGIADLRLEVVDVQSRDRMAYEIGLYALELRPAAGGTVVDRGRYVLVLEQESDGAWRRTVEMFNPEDPPPTAAEAPSGQEVTRQEVLT
jgi:uncharacterized protein (TIGR02246 family)